MKTFIMDFWKYAKINVVLMLMLVPFMVIDIYFDHGILLVILLSALSISMLLQIFFGYITVRHKKSMEKILAKYPNL